MYTDRELAIMAGAYAIANSRKNLLSGIYVQRSGGTVQEIPFERAFEILTDMKIEIIMSHKEKEPQ